MSRRTPYLLFLLALAPAWAAGAAPEPQIAQIPADVSASRIQRSIFVLASFRTRQAYSDPQPSGDGIGGARAWIRAEFDRVAAASGGRLKVETDEFDQPAAPPALPRPAHRINFAATLPGVRPDAAGRLYVLMAHYDSRAADPLDPAGAAPGADDNASGVAALLELARVLSARDLASTVVFLALDGGEQGQAGAAHWAERARARGLAVAAAFDLDCIGHVRGADGSIERSSVLLFGRPDDDLARAARDAARGGAPLAVKVTFRADALRGRGAQMPFRQAGFPAVRFAEARDDPARRYGEDRTDFVEFAYVADVARTAGVAVASLASAPASPRDAHLRAAPASGGVALSWSPNAEPDLAGYRVVWRDTTAPFWEHALEVPKDSLAATVPEASPDTCLFGVEAVDAAGRSSPASPPEGP